MLARDQRKRPGDDSLALPSVVRRNVGAASRLAAKLFGTYELSIGILSYLDVGDLVKCRFVCSSWKHVCDDDLLWKLFYESYFGVATVPSQQRRNWRSLFILEYNWHRGNCVVSYPLGKRTPHRVQFAVSSNIFFAIEGSLIRAFNKIGSTLASSSLTSDPSINGLSEVPISLSAFAVSCHRYLVIAGFSQGSIGLIIFTGGSFGEVCWLSPLGLTGKVSSVAYRNGILAIVTRSGWLRVYSVESETTLTINLIHSTVSPALRGRSTSVCIRSRSVIERAAMCISIAYTQRLLSNYWVASVQELHLKSKGELVKSRSTSCALGDELYVGHARETETSLISYVYPYLITGCPDGTINFTVVSDSSGELALKPIDRLWGNFGGSQHISVTDDGKALSVCADANELHWWDLKSQSRTIVSTRILVNCGGASLAEVARILALDVDRIVVELVGDSSKILMVCDFR